MVAEMKAQAKPLDAALLQRMNKTEYAYYQHLRLQKLAGEVLDFGFETHRLVLANNTSYTPDFSVLMTDGTIEMHEVKGFWRDDARVKIKVAARKFYYYTFKAIQRLPKKQGGGWDVELIKP